MQFLNNSSPTSLMLFEGEGVAKTPAELTKEAREAIAKNTTVGDPPTNEEVEEEEAEEGEEENEEELDDEGNPVKPKETDEEKAARETKEKADAKEARKEARIQKRIDTAVAAQKIAEAKVIELQAQLAANPDKKLTEEEVQSKAEVIASEKVAAKELERLQEEFNKTCDKMQAEAVKIDKDFTPKVIDMTNELGAIPSRIIGILSDLDNGAEVLAFMANDIDEAEKLYDLKNRPERLAIAIVRISDKLADAKKPKPKVISRVPNQGEPLKPARVSNSNQITGKETTEEYIAKRQRQREEQRKLRGY